MHILVSTFACRCDWGEGASGGRTYSTPKGTWSRRGPVVVADIEISGNRAYFALYHTYFSVIYATYSPTIDCVGWMGRSRLGWAGEFGCAHPRRAHRRQGSPNDIGFAARRADLLWVDLFGRVGLHRARQAPIYINTNRFYRGGPDSYSTEEESRE